MRETMINHVIAIPGRCNVLDSPSLPHHIITIITNILILILTNTLILILANILMTMTILIASFHWLLVSPPGHLQGVVLDLPFPPHANASPSAVVAPMKASCFDVDAVGV